MPQTVNQKRLLWPDVLRDVSALAVVLIHVSSYLCGKSAAVRLLRLVLR